MGGNTLQEAPWGWGGAVLSSGAEMKQGRGQQGSRRVWPVSRTGTGRCEEKSLSGAGEGWGSEREAFSQKSPE